MEILIIGGVAAGMSAASKIKRISPDTRVTVIEKGQTISYGACGLPYFVAGINDDPTRMLIRSKEAFASMGIDVQTRHEAVRLSPEDQTVLVRSLEDGALSVRRYDKLLIATGAAALSPPIPGMDLPGVYKLKTYEDGIALQAAVSTARRVAVVGGGYIGVELAEALHSEGKQVLLIEAAPYVLAPFDGEVREKILSRMREDGMEIHLSEPLKAVEAGPDGHVAAVRTEQGTYPADVVVVALGVRPATGFLQGTGIRMAPNGAIDVDREMRASLPNVYAAGDCAMVYHRVEEQNSYIALGTVANKCGRIAGGNMLGAHERFEGCLGSAAISVCGLEAARTGLGEETARQLYGEDVSTVWIESHDRPPYYPGATPVWVKLICEKRSRRILGGQAIGKKGAVLRVDSIAAAITGGLTAPEMGMADFCYAPPFAEVWDVLNIAGNAVK